MADQNLKQIQFKRSSTENKAPSADIVARGEIALNTHGRTLAIYTKDENDAVVQLAGKGVPFLDTSGTLNVDGTTTLKDNVTVAPNKSISFETTDLSGEITRHIVGKCATNDGWYIGAGGTSNSGILEIGTIDDGVETIQFVQRGAGNVEARKLVLLDSSGSTTLPGDLRLTTNKTVKISNGSTLTLEMGVGANDAYIKNLRGSGVLQLTNDSNLTFRNYQVYYAMGGKGPGKDGTLLTNVENERQLKQDNFPVTTGSEVRWIKVALLKDPGSSQSRLQLMVTNGGNYGSTRSSIDFIDCSARSFPTSLTSSNIRTYLQVRRLGDPALDETNQLRYSLVRTSEGLELWFTQRAFIGGVKVALLSIAGGTEYYLPTGYTSSSTEPEGLVESTAIRIYDELNKPNIDGGTEGILPISRGGTGGTSSAAARNNLGLGTAAIRDVGESTGNLLENGAYGLGGNGGKSINDIISNADMLNRLKAYGGTFWRGVTKSGVSVQNGLYSHGSGIFMNAGDTMSAINIDYASAKVRVYAANNSGLAAGNVNYNELYGTANKPNADDNDFVSKSRGGTFGADVTISGDITANTISGRVLKLSGGGAAYVPPSQGAYISWNKENGSGRTDFINHRSNTATVPGGFDFWNYEGNSSNMRHLAQIRNTGDLVLFPSDNSKAVTFQTDGNIVGGTLFGGNLNTYLSNLTGNANSKVSKSGDTMTGRLTIDMADTNTNSQSLYIKGVQHTPLILERNSDANISIAFRLTGTSPTLQRKLGLAKDGSLRWGTADNQTDNNLVFDTSSIRSVRVNMDSGYLGPEVAEDIGGRTLSIDDLFLDSNDVGTRRVYSCLAQGPGTNITGMPPALTNLKGDFLVIVEKMRSASGVDFRNKQTFISGRNNKTYFRYGAGTGTTAATTANWTAWEEVVTTSNSNGILPISSGGTGANNANDARNNFNIGLGQTATFGGLIVNGVGNNDPIVTFKNGAIIREAQGGSIGALIMSASTTATAAAKYIAFRPYGDSSNSEVRVKAYGNNETVLEWAQGPGVRSNTTGAFVVYAKAGQALHLRPNGDSASQATVIDQNGKMVVGGEFEAQNSKITGNLNVSEDNRMIVLGKNSDIGLVKKNGMPGKMAISKSNSFTVMASTNTNNQINPADTFNDIFKVDADGNQTVYGNAQINRQLTVSSAATINGTINANGGIIVPTTKYVQIADVPTQDNQATNKKYVDDKVASAISNAGDTYLPLAGGTVTGRLIITGDQLKTTSLWATGNSALNGNLEVGGNVVSNTGIGSFVGAVDVKAPAVDNGTTHLWFRHSNGGERGVIYMPGNNNTMMGLRAASSEWQFHGATGQITGPGARWTLHSDGNLQSSLFTSYGVGGEGYINNWVPGVANKVSNDNIWAWRISRGAFDVGMYIMAATHNDWTGSQEFTPGQTIAGSNLFWTTSDGGDWDYGAKRLSGTWMACGFSANRNNVHRTTIWKRIA
ncbi:putative tail fiber protein [Klebsiella phage vB_KpnM_Potts1]|uniref:Putative tail fiber protein n=1 Tax=Klebsiella phage vB_KpnM_Potts1 TaxID=2591366 RepID=A0A5B9NMX9_9CAUD|nr:putative tail fiber protein [Klebsiella phage vB_KpnM_Potts1]